MKNTTEPTQYRCPPGTFNPKKTQANVSSFCAGLVCIAKDMLTMNRRTTVQLDGFVVEEQVHHNLLEVIAAYAFVFVM